MKFDGTRPRALGALAASAMVLAGAAGAAPARAGGSNELVSVGRGGKPANELSSSAQITPDGRYVAFSSYASNLAPNDPDTREDVYLRDRAKGTTVLVSVSSAGRKGNKLSEFPSVTPEGRYVAFASNATNLAAGDTNGVTDCFVRDLKKGTTRLVSLGQRGVQGNKASVGCRLSADGRLLAFQSFATNLVPGDTNDAADIFVRDLAAGTTTRVSVGPGGVQAGGGSGRPDSLDDAISADGRYVAFDSSATNLTDDPVDAAHFDTYVRDLRTGTTRLVSRASDGTPGNGLSGSPALSADGRYIVFQSRAANLVPGDTNGLSDAFVLDQRTGKTTRVSVDSAGGQGTGGSFPRGVIFGPTISPDGRYVAFDSDVDGLVASDANATSDVFLHDRTTRRTTRVSVGRGGQPTPRFGSSFAPSVSAGGRFVAFDSEATNLVPGDVNGVRDVFVRVIGSGGG